MKKYSFYFLCAALIAFVTLPNSAFAGNPLTNNPLLNRAAGRGGYATKDAADTTIFAAALGSIVFALVSFLGILFIGLIIYGGYLWMTAKGNEQQVQKAKHTIRDAIIGLLVLTASCSIWALLSKFIFGT